MNNNNSNETNQTFLLQDNFDSENNGNGRSNYNRLTNWNVTNGTIDLAGVGTFYDFLPGNGLYLDLDGSSFNAGRLESQQSFSFNPGDSIKLEFSLAGSQRRDTNTVDVSLGDLWQETFTLASSEPFTKITRNINVTSATDANLVFDHSGGDFFGLLLDNVELSVVSISNTDSDEENNNDNNDNTDSEDSDNNNDDNSSENDNENINLTSELALYEKLAKNLAYEDWEQGNLTNNKVIKDIFDRELAIDGYTVNDVFDDPTSGFYAVGLTSETYNPVLVIRGTEIQSIEDILADLETNVIGESQFISQAATNAKIWLQNKHNPDIIGHSLGGVLAQLFTAELTKNGNKVNNLFTFNSPGITQEYADLFDRNNIENVHHYIVSGDPVSLAGHTYLDDKNTEDDDVTIFSYNNLSDRSLFSLFNIDRHLRNVINVDDIQVSARNISIAQLSNDNFNYYPDPDYLLFQFLLSGLKPISLENTATDINLAAALTTRGSTEAARRMLGNYTSEQIGKLENGEKIELPNLEFGIPQAVNIDIPLIFGESNIDDGFLFFKSEDLSLEYVEDNSEKYLQIGGKASLQLNVLINKPIKGEINFADNDFIAVNGTENLIRLGEDNIHLVGEAQLENILFGNFGLKQATLFFDLEKDTAENDSQWQFNEWKTTASIQLPNGVHIGGGIGYIYNPVTNQQEFNYITVRGGGILLYDFSYNLFPVGLYLKEISGTIDNIASVDPEDLSLSADGTLSLEPTIFGNKIEVSLFNVVPVEASSLMELTGGISLDKNSLTVRAGISAGVGIEGGIEFFSGILSGRAEGTIDWSEERFTLSSELSLINNFIEITGNLTINLKDRVTIATLGTGTVKLPGYTNNLDRNISLFGFSDRLLEERSTSTAFYYNKNNSNSDDYIAGWGDFFWFEDIGLKYTFDGKLEYLGLEGINSIRDTISQEFRGESSTNFGLNAIANSAENNDFQTILDLALTKSKNKLTQFAKKINYEHTFDTVFGNNWNQNIANNLIKKWQTENFNNLPQISSINAEAIDNANAAFADATNTIYIAREYIAYQQHNPEAISEVLLEEIGHWVDSQINSIDAAGDEGDIFSRLIRNETISEEQLLALQSENDTINISLDGTLTELNLNTSTEDIFSVAAETPWLSIAANWENANDNVALELVAPNGTIYTEADIANNENIHIVDELSDSTHKIVYIDNPDAGDWKIKLPNSNNLGNLEFAALGGTNKNSIDITLLEQNTNNNTVTINYEASDLDSDARISFFYDTDHQGFDGFLIPETVTENDGAGSFTWNTEGIATGEYYLYAMTADDNSIPVFDYSEESINITEEADLSVNQTVNFNPVALGDDLTYKVTVVNNGETTSKGITVTTTIPESATFQSASINFNSQTENKFTFNIGDLAAGADKQIEIIITPPDTQGEINSQSLVASKTFDADATNNIVVVNTTVSVRSYFNEDTNNNDNSEEDTSNEDTNNDDNSDGENTTISEDLLETNIFRFQNNNVPGTYLFAGESESANIRENFPNFVEEGLAFQVGIEPGDNLISIYRFQSLTTPGTYIFVGEEERQGINENYSNSFTEEGLAFYVYGAGSDLGTTFYRFHNTGQPGTYIFAGSEERANIIANFPGFEEEGAAFEVGV